MQADIQDPTQKLPDGLSCVLQRDTSGGSANATWHSCYKCRHKMPDSSLCYLMWPNLEDEATMVPDCMRSYGIHDPILPSLYAAQLAWWLRFFPPERFLVLPSTRVHDKATAMKVRSEFLLRYPACLQKQHFLLSGMVACMAAHAPFCARCGGTGVVVCAVWFVASAVP